MSDIERCNWPFGSSEALSVRCARPKGHGGEHRSVFEPRGSERENDLRQQLKGAVEALREIKRVAAIEAPPVSDEVPAKVWKIAHDALGGR